MHKTPVDISGDTGDLPLVNGLDEELEILQWSRRQHSVPQVEDVAGSTTCTAEYVLGALADQLALADPRIQVMHRASKLGLGSAYRAAFARGLADAHYQYFLEMDTDLSHDVRYLPDFCEALDAGYDADLIAVEQNPLDTITAILDPLLVVSNGRIGLDRLNFGRGTSPD